MSYLALARKWRPTQFSEVVGQSHVLTALGNALAQNRLHHAYLFSGTRGVGKTTIGRLFAKGLNCETGITAQPCGQCSTCQEIDQGRFVDLLEIDAASRTRIEDTRELLDNVQYKPARGRFKVYLIDEVHMLSRHSFNALLKTLEEPPEYVKFLLATTDPQKLPVTILSRCLQFHLKPISIEHIEQQLDFILKAEGVESHPRALGLIAHAADGSMRDALSLTDQAIALGNGLVSDDVVSHMLGTIDTDQALHLIQALSYKQAQQVIDCVNMMAVNGVEWDELLQTLASQLHRIAMYQMLPSTLDQASPDAEKIIQLAQVLPPEDVQLFYQIALKGREDLPLSPTPRIGLEMILLRMVAFRPETISPVHAISTYTVPTAPEPQASSPAAQAGPSSPDSVTSVSAAESRIESAMPSTQTLMPQTEPSHLSSQDTPSQAPSSQGQLSQDQPSSAFSPQTFSSQEKEPEVPVSSNTVRPNTAASTTLATDAESPEKPAMPPAAGAVGLRHQLRSQRMAKKSEAHPPQASGTSQQSDFSKQSGFSQPSNFSQPPNVPQPPIASQPRSKAFGAPDQSDTSQPSGDSPKKSSPAASKAGSVFERLTQKRGDDDMPVLPCEKTPIPIPTSESAPEPEGPYQWRPSKVQEVSPPSHFTPAELRVSLEHEKTPEMMARLVEEVIQEDEWAAIIHQLDIPKLVEQLALNSCYQRTDNGVQLTLRASQAHLNTEKSRTTLNEALNAVLDCSCQLSIDIGDDGVTPLEKREQYYQSKLTQAFENLNTDPNIQWIQQRFQGQLDKASVRPI